MRPGPRRRLAAASAFPLMALAGLTGCTGSRAGPPGTAAIPGGAIVVPGLPRTVRTVAAVTSVSCPSAGNCAAAGNFDVGNTTRPFVVSEVDGSWRPATPVRGLPYRNDGAALAISCPSPGNCSAVGRAGVNAGIEGFAVSEVDGTWRGAEVIHGVAELTLVSCASPGNCSAAGYHTGRGIGPYMVSEVNGRWGRAAALPRARLLYRGLGEHPVTAVSCASPGNCVAAGSYQDPSSLRWRPYLVNQTEGAWRAPVKAGGLPALDAGGAGRVSAVSCASPGNCWAGGSYQSWRHGWQPFVVSEVNGTWGAAHAISARAGLRVSAVTSLWCPPAGGCTAAGTAGSDHGSGFVVSQVHGTWGLARRLRTPYRWSVYTVLLSCATAGACAIAGDYGDPYFMKPYVVTEANGAWGRARRDPNASPFSKGKDVTVAALSCAPRGGCVAGGSYGTGIDIPGQQDTQYIQAFLLTIG